MEERQTPLRALILAGGSGTRFWPLSRRRRPKQLLALDAEESLLQVTVERLAPLIPPAEVWVVTTRELALAVREQLPGVPPEQILAEPEGRNTAPAIGWSIRSMGAAGRDAAVAVFPADHRMADPEAFRRVLAAAHRAVAADDRVMTLGVAPRWAESGYGYLELGETVDEATGLRRVVRFTEKPDPETARRFFESGRYLWNAGIFVFRGGRLLDLLAEHEPEVAAGLDAIAAAADSDSDGDGPAELEALYAGLKSISIDHAVMERCADLVTLTLDAGWSDLGSWEALAEVLAANDPGNVERGDVLALDGDGNLLMAESGSIAALGVSDLVIVQTGDAVLVVPRSRSQEVKTLVEELRRRGRDDLL